jgi:hypothetical protein
MKKTELENSAGNGGRGFFHDPTRFMIELMALSINGDLRLAAEKSIVPQNRFLRKWKQCWAQLLLMPHPFPF